MSVDVVMMPSPDDCKYLNIVLTQQSNLTTPALLILRMLAEAAVCFDF